MPRPTQSDLNAGIADIESALKEDRTIVNAESAWQALKSVTSFLLNRVPEPGYDTLTEDLTDFGGV